MASSSDGRMRRQDGRRLFEYFVVAGLDDSRLEPLSTQAQECGQRNAQQLAPITDICVIFPSLGEVVPDHFECLSTTPLGYPADLNHGGFRVPNAYICFRRGFHKPPLVDIGVLDKGRGEKPCVDSTTVTSTPFGRSANINNASLPIFLTFRRAAQDGPPSQLVVTHLCVILVNKGEVPPHTYYKIPSNLNRGLVGSDVFLCYKKSQGTCKRIAYKPRVLDCFPALPSRNESDSGEGSPEKHTNGEEGEEDLLEPSLVDNVPMFCLPMGAAIECWPAKCQQPDKTFSTFVLTNEAGCKFYGASVTFYEVYKNQLTEEQMEKLEVNTEEDEGPLAATVEDSGSTNDPAEQLRFYVNCSICIVSKYPFFGAFKRFLFHIHRMAVDPRAEHPLPIERFISHLMYEVSFPTSRRPRVLMHLGAETVAFESYDDSQLPLSGAALFDTLKYLGTETLMYLMLLTLLEQKILIHSLRPFLLTAVAESVLALMFPFHWVCPYVPQCPLALAGVVHAPVPFIAGVDSRYFELFEEPPVEVTCFDLDTGTISMSAVRKATKLSMFPKGPVKQLRSSLDKIRAELSKEDFRVSKQYTADFVPVDTDHIIQKKRKHIETQIHDAFLRFMGLLMRDYQRHLRPITSAPSAHDMDTANLFDKEAFIRSRDKGTIEFYRKFSETQLFERFIQERCFVSDKNTYNAFFDDCIAKVVAVEPHGIEPALLDQGEGTATSASNDHTVFIAPPEPILDENGEERSFEYKEGFPRKLDVALFQMDKLNLDPRGVEGAESSAQHEETRCVCLRTKPEVRSSLMAARNAVKINPINWAKTLLFYSYSLWFMSLPSLLKLSRNKKRTLRLAFHVLGRMENTEVFPLDQVCFRILISVCGELDQAALAVNVLQAMRRQAIEQNAVTYGVYHRAVMNAKWPSSTSISASRAWATLRVMIGAVARLRAAFARSHGRPPSGSGVPPPEQETSANREGEKPAFTIEHIPMPPAAEVEKENEDGGIDPLGAIVDTPLKEKETSAVPSPSRAKFLEMHSTSQLFKEPPIIEVTATPVVKEKKNGASSWLKGISNSPIVRMIKSQTFDTGLDRRSSSDAASTSSHGNESTSNAAASIPFSPSFNYLLGNMKKVAQDSARSGLRIVNGLGRSVGPSGSGTLFGGDDDDSTDGDPINPDDPAFLLDFGKTGAILGEEAWMESDESGRQDEDEIVLEVTMSTCSLCPACQTMVYDEDAMAGWKVDDQTLVSDCPYCGDSAGPSTSSSSDRGATGHEDVFIPELRVRRRWLDRACASWYTPSERARRAATPRVNEHGVDESRTERSTRLAGEVQRRNEAEEPETTVAFLSPIVLRKEMETLLAADVHALTDRSLISSHPVVFWNLVYYMKRLALPSHLYSWLGSSVHIRCVYDRPDMHKDLIPLYFQNPEFSKLAGEKASSRSEKVWTTVTQAVSGNELFVGIQAIINEHRRLVNGGGVVVVRHFPLFRDVLFTSLNRFGRQLMRDHLDLAFRDEMKHVPPRLAAILPRQDQPQKAANRACRKGGQAQRKGGAAKVIDESRPDNR